ncbi:unnamed protein product [Owenia fusiformis]|uniref:G-protein coupled receptors family 1 profile domain-containing protein n=1 Tax=Owenia fusiformis TaxID=6347 RepID=A0A8S4N4V4_OWEFU|nr:unnamed protein product [Owenia fusiformis]
MVDHTSLLGKMKLIDEFMISADSYGTENNSIETENNGLTENDSFTEPTILDHSWTNNNVSNSSLADLGIIKPELLKSQMVIHMTIECIIMVAICGGNIVVLISIGVYKSLHTVNNMFLVSLAMGDLLMGVLGSPMSIITLYVTPLLYGTHIQDKYLCATRLFSMVSSVGISVYSMVGIAIDRYTAVVRPLRYRELVTRSKVFSYILFVWVYVIVGSAFIFYKDVIFFESGEICRSNLVMDQDYSTFLKVNLLVAFIISTVAHFTVAVVATKHKARITTELAQFNNNLAVAYRKESKITTTMTVIVGVFMLCWLPWTISSMINWQEEPQWFTSLRYYMVELHVANSALNPLIYAYRLKPMRKAMGRIIRFDYKGTISES